MKGGYPENTGEIITNSILIRINESGDPDSNIDITQEELKKENIFLLVVQSNVMERNVIIHWS